VYIRRVGHTTDIALVEARALIERGIDKAEQIGMRGAIVVIGGTGALVSGSRMDHGGAGGFARARSKAWIAATQQIPSSEHLGRMRMIPPPMVSGFTVISPEAIFPGAGGMPIRAADATGGGAAPVIAGIAASGAAIGPFVDYAGADPEKLIADGGPSNGEDLLVHYALDIPYEGQHGDDLERWVAAYGPFPADAGPGLGMAPAPPAQAQLEHRWALGISELAMELAASRGLLISVAIVDRRGDPIQLDRMDGAVAASPPLAEALAATAASFGVESQDLRELYPDELTFGRVAAALPYSILPAPGGVPLLEQGLVVAGLGIAGPPPDVCRQLAVEVASQV
jgi:uncharacterized protein GlcG (DUF336 family)